MDHMYIFTHIAKTMGTTFAEVALYPNIDPGKIKYFPGHKNFLLHINKFKNCDCLIGHSSYGFHRFLKRDTRYTTFLRDPIDRSISFYYFIRSFEGTSRYSKYADKTSLKGFYQNKLFHNRMTKCISGCNPLYPSMYRWYSDSKMLKQAFYNINNRYFFFGIKEKFEDSIEIFMRKTKFKNIGKMQVTKKTPRKPNIENIDSETMDVIKNANRLDRELYDHAVKIFDDQC